MIDVSSSVRGKGFAEQISSVVDNDIDGALTHFQGGIASDLAFLIKLIGQPPRGAFDALPIENMAVTKVKSVLDQTVNSVNSAATRETIKIIRKYAKVQVVVIHIPLPTVSVLREEASRD